MLDTPPLKGKALVLVVEDEPFLRMCAVDMLEEDGFDVIEASNATEAVVLLETRMDIRIVFTDIDMPGGMDGMRLAACIRDRWPPVEIIITSGQVVPKDLPLRSLFFSKPYEPDIIVAQMNRFIA